jgi:biopolymer transport protein ExbB/TolQ
MSTLAAWYNQGGPLMSLILAVGLVGVALMAERLYAIVVRSKTNGRLFIERTIQLVRGGKIDEAIKLCASSNAALPDIGLLILRSRSREEVDLRTVSEAAALAVLPKLQRRLGYLPALTWVALLVGALGLLLGLRAALGATIAGGPATQALTRERLARAFDPPALACIVAMVLTLGHAYLASQAGIITTEIQEFAARLINALVDRPDVRLGHR